MSSVAFIPYKSRRHVLSATQRDELPIVLIGEPGSGKSSLAKWIHESGPRSGRTFVSLTRKRPWEDQILEANGGSILFPEWETCDFPERELIQKLLRSRTLQTLSTGTDSGLVHMINARVLLPALRLDSELALLLEVSPLRTIQIVIPALKDRTNELLDISLGVLRELAHVQMKDYVSGFDAETTAALLAYDWPGNIRELRNVLSFALTRSHSDLITMKDLPKLGDESIDFFASRDEFEKSTVLEALRQSKGNIEQSAQSLRVSKEHLLQKIQKYRIEESEFLLATSPPSQS